MPATVGYALRAGLAREAISLLRGLLGAGLQEIGL